jgi:predicted phosphate transport protein (TIGR00153 family)
MKNILKNFYQKILSKEESLFINIENFSKEINNSILNFQEFYFAIKEINEEKIKEKSQVIELIETEADELRRSIIDRLISSSIFSYIRDDLIILIDKMDDIADNIKDATRLLSEYAPSKNILKILFQEEDMESYIECIINSVKVLHDSILSLKTTDVKNLLKLLKDVEKYEEKADIYKVKLLKKVYNEFKNFDILDIIKVRDFILMIDNIADAAEDASDIMLQIFAKGLI